MQRNADKCRQTRSSTLFFDKRKENENCIDSRATVLETFFHLTAFEYYFYFQFYIRFIWSLDYVVGFMAYYTELIRFAEILCPLCNRFELFFFSVFVHKWIYFCFDLLFVICFLRGVMLECGISSQPRYFLSNLLLVHVPKFIFSKLMNRS